MELQLSPDQELFRTTTQRFLEDSCPLTTVRALADSPNGYERDWWRRGAELGWTSMLVDEKNGGGSISGEGLRDLALVAFEMGRLVSPGPFVPTNVVASALSAGFDASGSNPVLQTVLHALVAGEQTAAWCFDEPGPGWGPSAIGLRAEPGPGGSIVLNGVKAPVEAGSDADHFLVSAKSGNGLTQVLVPRDAAGVRVTPRGGVDLVRRFATVRFDNVSVPSSNVVGSVGAAADAVERQLQIAAVLQLAETVGVMSRVFEFTTEWAFDRVSFGRPLASYQALKHRFADMKLWLEGSNATSRAALNAVQQGRPNAGELVSAAKSYVGEHAPELVQDCVQMHGGIGVTWDHDIHLYLRRATVNCAMYGTTGDHRLRLATAVGLG